MHGSLPLGFQSLLDPSQLDFERLHRFTAASAFFMTRSKDNIHFKRLTSRQKESAEGVRSDQIVVLATADSRKHYPDKLRRIRFSSNAAGTFDLYQKLTSGAGREQALLQSDMPKLCNDCHPMAATCCITRPTPRPRMTFGSCRLSRPLGPSASRSRSFRHGSTRAKANSRPMAG